MHSSVLQSAFPYFSAHIHMKMLTNFTCLPYWCINWTTEVVNCSRLSLKLVEALGLSGILQHIVELSSVQCAEIHCVKLANFRQIKPNTVPVYPYWQTLLLWKICFTSNMFEAVEINFHPKCQICLLELCSWLRNLRGIPVMCPVWCLSLTRSIFLSSKELGRGIDL